jgi:methylenetetrahydrofolate reductase (NADPH)
MEYINIVLDEFHKNPSISYQATRKAGEITRNIPEDTVIAVTWGIFPNREVIQPTIVDTVSFKAWRDEAFSVWTNEWARIYDSGSESYRLLNSIAENFYLVNVVENDFVDGNLENVFIEIFRKIKTQSNSIN